MVASRDPGSQRPRDEAGDRGTTEPGNQRTREPGDQGTREPGVISSCPEVHPKSLSKSDQNRSCEEFRFKSIMDRVQHWVNPPPPPPPPVPAGFRLEVSSKVYQDVPCGDGVTRRAYAMLWKSELYPSILEVQNVRGEIKSFLQGLGMWQFVSSVTDWKIEHYDEPPYREPPMQQESGSMPPMQQESEQMHMPPMYMQQEREFLEEFGPPLFEQRDEIMSPFQERDRSMPP